ncbi:MAG: hypothetical protein V8R40_07400 [Dysosmobacter sp.]
MENYVQGVLPYETPGTFAPGGPESPGGLCPELRRLHDQAPMQDYGFDVCNTTDRQVYNGVNLPPLSGATRRWRRPPGSAFSMTDELVEAVYHSSDGGATEDAANVWGSEVPYLKGKTDPYEAMTTIPNYTYTVTYTLAELTWVLQNSGYSIGTVQDVIISE